MSDDMAPEDWVPGDDEEPIVGDTFTHPSEGFEEAVAEARARLEVARVVVTGLAELRRAVGLTQTDVAERWGRGQSYVSKVEQNPAGVEMATLVSYVRALGGRLTVTVEAGDHVFVEELVDN